MIDPKTLALLVIGLTFIIFAWQRNRLIDITCTGVFFNSYIIFVLAGVLSSPWSIKNDLPQRVPHIRWSEINDRDLVLVILVVAGGMGLVLLGHMGMDIVRMAVIRQQRAPWGYLLQSPSNLSAGYIRKRSYLLSTVFLGLASAMFLTRLPAFVQGIASSYIGGNGREYYVAREAIQELGLLYYLLIFNALPFLSILFWIIYRHQRNARNTFWAWLVVSATSFFLLATFEKRPFILYLLCLFLAHGISEIYAGRLKVRIPRSFPTAPRYWLFRVPWFKITLALGIPFLCLVGFYYLTTNIATNSASTGQAFLSLAEVALSHIFSRLSGMPILYVHYFPAIHPHYGLTNISKLTSILGLEHFSDTRIVFRYFAGRDWGGGAIGAIVDFYSAFGWWGWGFCCLGLGVFLNVLDKWLSLLPATPLNRTLYIFMLVFAYYLSQANLARSLSSYGGLTFFLLWILLSMRLKWSTRPAVLCKSEL